MSYKILKFEQLNSFEWDSLLTNLKGNTFLNCADMIKYKVNLVKTKNISFAIFEGKKCLAAICLGVSRYGHNDYELSFGNTYCPEPIFNKTIGVYELRKIKKHLWNMIVDLAKKYNCKKYKFSTHPISFKDRKAQIDISNQFYYLKWCQNYNVNNTIIIDLNLSKKKLWENLSKYHRKNLRKIDKSKMKINLIDHKSDKKFLEQKFNSFKSAHIRSAGKQTRPDITWEIMKSLVSKKKACLFTLSLKKDSKDISFLFCGIQNNFSAGWSQVNLEQYEKEYMPRHILEWQAILMLKKFGIKFYEIGERFYKTQSYNPSEKEISISDFKEKFGGTFYPKIYYEYKFN